jgi:membrane protein
MLLFMAIGGIVLQNSEWVREQVVGLIVGLLPQGQDALRKMIVDVIKAKGTAAGIGIALLLWSALGWFQVIDKNVNKIWGVSRSRPFIRGKLFALAMVGAIGGVGLLSFGATAAVRLLAQYTDAIPGSAAIWQAVVTGLSLLIIALAFYLLYRYVPQRRLHFEDIWPAALATAVLWELTRYGLAIYFEKNDLISGYGPIGAAMALLFWLYVASMIILVGAELSYSIAKERRHIDPEEEMEVVARPGEQPTPKFAPQVGGETPPVQGQGAR